ncbi:myelin and lymphocyte protein-like isoform X2 [Ctenopharyngodon idella]|uniref:myelin and lymphocyte protein-like isoform X2 n=1 Tax=Ctenopharyngodon idella TaxID=7959 RepID=UPI002231EFAE|nr:myelin and lymphocyte protein-like isoform X2 [Ctenopharyngodon idella]
MASSVRVMPSGTKIFTTVPDILFIPEFVFGGLVWTLVASTHLVPGNPLGWVMFVSLFCFLITTLWFFIFITGINQSSIWPGLDFIYHLIAVTFYLSASVILAYVTLNMKTLTTSPFNVYPFKYYQIDIAAVVFSYIATLLYFIHCVLSAARWKSF